MNVKKLIKRKYRLKYIVLALLVALYIPLIGVIITQFKVQDFFLWLQANFVLFVEVQELFPWLQGVFVWLVKAQELFPWFQGAFILLALVDAILVFIYEKILVLRNINNNDTLKAYLEYFSMNRFSDLEYTESITWFSRLVQEAFRRKGGAGDAALDDAIAKLYLVLRPDSKGLCAALQRRTAFVALCTKLVDSGTVTNDINDDIAQFENNKIEKYKPLGILQDKGIIIYIVIPIVHIFACFVLADKEKTPFDWRTFWGNLLLYLPTDALLFFVYIGIVKEKKS